MSILSTKNLRRKGLPTSSGALSRVGFRFWFIPLLVIVVGGVGWWTRSVIETTLKDRIAENLETILDTDIAALGFWLQAHRNSTSVLADRTRLRALATEIVEAAQSSRNDTAVLLALPALQQLREFLAPPMEDYGFVGFGIIDRTGLLLATADDPTLGLRLDAEHVPIAEAAFRGVTGVSRPFRASFDVDETANLQPGAAIMLVIAPVYGADGNVFAALGFAIDVDAFSQILGIARAGESGETYAFDADGRLLSNSRFEDELRQIGLLPEDPEVDSVLNIDIRNPGGDLRTGFVPPTNRRAQPLTVAAAAAVSGEDGVNVEGYNDYRGVPVVGAWRWLEDFGIGVATEQDHDEAYSALHRLRTIQTILLSLVILGAGAMVFESVVIARLGRKVTAAVLEARQLGQYTLEKKIGEGGMGEVYRASHAMLRRPTAVKLLRPDKANETDIARFEREVQLTAQLTHPNTIRIYDFGRTPEDVFYYAMEYLNGINLQDLVEQAGPQPAGRVIYVLQQACGSLAEAHGIDLIHRDIKPANIMLCDRGGVHDVAKVLDFGIVKDLGTSGDAQLTQAGAFSGTPLYIAPETIRSAEDVDARVDVYALGAVGYFMLTGQTIFPVDIPAVDILTRQLTEMPPPPSEVCEVAMPADLDELIMRCLAKEADGRPAGAADLLDELLKLEDANAWGAREAKRWWALHEDLGGFSTKGSATTDQSQVGRTIAIDVHDRA